MKYFDRDFCEREDDPVVSRKAIEYYSGARRYFEGKLESHNAASADPETIVAVQADLGRAVGRLGEALRFAGRIPEALECKVRVLGIWELLGRSRAIVLARIRLAIVLDQGARARESLEILRVLRGGLTAVFAESDSTGAHAAPGNPDTNSGNCVNDGITNPVIRYANYGICYADLEPYLDFIYESLALVLLRRKQPGEALPELRAALDVRVSRGQEKMIERTRELIRRAEERIV